MREALGSPLGENKGERRATFGPEKDYLADNTTVQVWRDVVCFRKSQHTIFYRLGVVVLPADMVIFVTGADKTEVSPC